VGQPALTSVLREPRCHMSLGILVPVPWSARLDASVEKDTSAKQRQMNVSRRKNVQKVQIFLPLMNAAPQRTMGNGGESPEVVVSVNVRRRTIVVSRVWLKYFLSDLKMC